MLLECCYAKDVWWGLLNSIDCICTFPQQQHFQLQDWWRHLSVLQPREKRKGFHSIFMLTAWHLWKERDNRLFRNSSATAVQLRGLILQEALLWVAAGAAKLGELLPG
ncbi:hypothetical protein PAHAL_8G066600 [Panicum hallii]|uniref:Uncharacterized protein n=1 Tax=Panicum hallii TaxID=206008 RepID=A0A2T8I7Z8_9POAL|nr:hypothetical protein PAHAL_8G066600 [Panicum hallii]